VVSPEDQAEIGTDQPCRRVEVNCLRPSPAIPNPARSFIRLRLHRGFGIGDEFLEARRGAQIVPFRAPTVLTGTEGDRLAGETVQGGQSFFVAAAEGGDGGDVADEEGPDKMISPAPDTDL